MYKIWPMYQIVDYDATLYTSCNMSSVFVLLPSNIQVFVIITLDKYCVGLMWFIAAMTEKLNGSELQCNNSKYQKEIKFTLMNFVSLQKHLTTRTAEIKEIMYKQSKHFNAKAAITILKLSQLLLEPFISTGTVYLAIWLLQNFMSYLNPLKKSNTWKLNLLLRLWAYGLQEALFHQSAHLSSVPPKFFSWVICR